MILRATRAALVSTALAGGLLLSACGGAPTSAPSAPTASGAAAASSSYAPITVYAAASLTTTFDEIGARVKKETGVDIQFQYAGSSDLAAQLGQGGPGDVFASANEKQMKVAVDAGSVAADAPKPFATNTLTVVTPPNNPGKVTSLADLAKPGVSTVVCAPQVPCGAATTDLFAAQKLTVKPVSEESKVTDVLGKISSGQADAGLVYVTDATGAGGAVKTVNTPEAAGIRNTYPIAVTAYGAKDPARAATAQKFVDAVLDAHGQEVLKKAGFGSPSQG